MRAAIVSFTLGVHSTLALCSWVAAAIVVALLLPLAFFPRTRAWAGNGMLIAAWVFGATLWFLAFSVAFGAWGWPGIIASLFLIPGLGVVPVGIAAAFLYGGSPGIGITLVGLSVVTCVVGAVGVKIAERGESERMHVR